MGGGGAFHIKIGLFSRLGGQRKEITACLLIGQEWPIIDDDGNDSAIVNPAKQAPLRPGQSLITVFSDGYILSRNDFARQYQLQG